MTKLADGREVRILDLYGFDITDLIIDQHGSIEAWQEYTAAVRALLDGALDRLTAALD